MAKYIGFGYLPDEYCDPKTAKIAVVPAPYDQTSTWIKGADQGPEAVIEASGNMELYDIETGSEVYKHGILTDEPVERDLFPEDMVQVVRQRVQKHIDRGRFPVVIGGEHSVSIGAVQAQAENNDELCVLQLDAHADLRDKYEGSKYNHACVMARIKELCPIVQVGIRSMSEEETAALDSSSVFFARDIHNKTDWAGNVVAGLSDKVYVTIDLDVFDPSIMPSTGTPEPGGLYWYPVLSLLKTVFAERDVVGFDVVELCPNSRNKAPDFLAAKLIYKLLTYKFEG
ncbi:MAG: agmatinase [Sedimentisphaerales bacterium]|nr:agmatinase [Sedimentisphaerales bacterium]